MNLLKDIQKIVDGTVEAFIADIAARYDLSEDELREMWSATSKTKTRAVGAGRRTGYQLFSAEVREELRRDDPAMPFGMISKTIARRWKECPTRDEYNKRARAGHDRPASSPASSTSSTRRAFSRQKRGTARGLAR